MNLSIVTSVYPAVKKYLNGFFESLKNQTDNDFKLWIALDGINAKDVLEISGNIPNTYFVSTPPCATPALVRNTVLEEAVKDSNYIVLVDSDDLLLCTRVASAKESVISADLTATAMLYIDENGKLLPGIFDPTLGDKYNISNNIFGLTNTTWNAEVLAQTLPIPQKCVIADWYIASIAICLGAKTAIDIVPRMLYRQHSKNIASVKPTFFEDQIIFATNLVLNHYDLLSKSLKAREIEEPENLAIVNDSTNIFLRAISDPKILKEYVKSLNEMKCNHVWWSCVAHPELENLWKN